MMYTSLKLDEREKGKEKQGVEGTETGTYSESTKQNKGAGRNE